MKVSAAVITSRWKYMIDSGKRVLVTGPRYYNFLESVASAFRILGWECSVVGYDTPLDPYGPCSKCLYRLSSRRGKERLLKRNSEALGKRLEASFLEFRPDLVFVMNGDSLPVWLFDSFRKSSKVVLWLFDNLSKMPGVRPILTHTDKLYSFDASDADALRADGLDALFLPQACDTSVYRPTSATRDIDILFIGNIYYYPNRRRLLERVIDAFPQRKILFIGSCMPWYKNPLACLLRKRRDVYTNSDVSPQEANSYYNRAVIAINIHREDQTNGANPRFFEICGSGTYQVCDRNPYVESVFPDGEVGFFSNEDELVESIRYALSNDVSLKACEACRKVTARHSFVSRISQVLRDSGWDCEVL